MSRILFVCTGNICRSPTAEGVFRLRAEARGLNIHQADSAGITDFHAGEPPDRRAAAAALKRGYDLSPIRARALREQDFSEFDLFLGMDATHVRNMEKAAPPVAKGQILLFSTFCDTYAGADIPDPYYGGKGGFETVLDMIEEGVDGLLSRLESVPT